MFASPTGIALIETIADRSYTLARHEGTDTTQPPAQRYALVGVPNVSDCLAALPEGFTYSGGDLPQDPQPPPSVTAWQIRRYLLSKGITMADVDAAINSIADTDLREQTKVDWEYAPHIERSHPMLVPLAAALGISDIDAAFIAAEQIS
jgi:hypothetical protein